MQTYMKLNAASLRDRCLNKMLGIVVEHYDRSCDRNLVSGFLNTVNLSFESARAQLEIAKETPKRQTLLAALDSIETGVMQYMVKNPHGYRTTEEYIANGYAQEAAASEVFEEEVGGSNMAAIVAELLEEMAEAPPEEIKSLAKEILKMEKDEQDNNKQQDESEQKDFVEEGDDDEQAKDGSNPFNDDSKDDSNSDESGSKDGSNSNVFDTEGSDGNSSNDNVFAQDDNEDSSNNPFNSNEQDSNGSQAGKDEGSQNSNPFASTGDMANDSSNNSGSGNPFESYSGSNNFNITAGDVYTSAGIESGDIASFVTKYIAKFQMENMEKAFNEYGVESAEFMQEKAKYTKYAEKGIHSICTILACMEALGIHLDMYKFKYSM